MVSFSNFSEVELIAQKKVTDLPRVLRFNFGIWVKGTKTGELVTKDDATEQGVLFAENADGLVADFIEAISHHRFHNRQVDKIMA